MFLQRNMYVFTLTKHLRQRNVFQIKHFWVFIYLKGGQDSVQQCRSESSWAVGRLVCLFNTCLLSPLLSILLGGLLRGIS